MDDLHDQAFFQILTEKQNVTNFLDAFFGFLFRCTDFYVESNPDQKLGFPPGVAEKLIYDSFHKWKSKYQESVSQNCALSSQSLEECPAANVVQEVEVETRNDTVQNIKKFEESSDCYNGAIHDNYTWSQTIDDLDIIVMIPGTIRSTKDLKIEITADEMRVAVKTNKLKEARGFETRLLDITDEFSCSEWTFLLKGQFTHKIRKDESIWSFVPGLHISIHLEKIGERWWEALLKGETKIELNKIDCTRNLDELGTAEQMKVQELMWNHQQKLLNKPTVEEMKMEKILKKAWNAEGSPFKGTEYDPSLVKFN